MTYLIEKAASAYVTEKADGLNIEESFFLYILAQNWANGDEFSWACGGVEEEWVSKNGCLLWKRQDGVSRRTVHGRAS